MTTEKPQSTPSPGGPLVRELTDRLRQFLLTECRPGEKLPTEIQLGRTHGRSVTTVRRALAVLAAEGLLFRRRGSGTYASGDLPQITGATGVLVPGPAKELLNELWCRESFRGIIEAAAEAGRHLHVIFGRLMKPYVVPEDIVRRIRLGHMDSIICLDLFDAQLLTALSGQMVTVSLDMACGVSGVSSCALQHEQTVDLAVEHLWRLGHRRLSLIGVLPQRDQDPATHLRRQAFLGALRARDLPVAEDAIVDVYAPKPPQVQHNVAQWAERWTQTPPARRATGLLLLDLWPAAFCLDRLNVRVPRDVSLIALDEPDPSDVWARAVRRGPTERDLASLLTGRRMDPADPAMSRLRNLLPAAADLPFAEMGRWAVQEIVRRTDQPDAEPQHVTFPGHMLPGNTAAPPPPQRPD